MIAKNEIIQYIVLIYNVSSWTVLLACVDILIETYIERDNECFLSPFQLQLH